MRFIQLFERRDIQEKGLWNVAHLGFSSSGDRRAAAPWSAANQRPSSVSSDHDITVFKDWHVGATQATRGGGGRVTTTDYPDRFTDDKEERHSQDHSLRGRDRISSGQLEGVGEKVDCDRGLADNGLPSK